MKPVYPKERELDDNSTLIIRSVITCSSTRCSRMSLYLNEEEFKEALSE